MKILTAITILILVSGCTLLPAPLSQLSNIGTAYDTVMLIEGKPTSTDLVVSKLTGKNCRVIELDCKPKTATELMAEYVEENLR